MQPNIHPSIYTTIIHPSNQIDHHIFIYLLNIWTDRQTDGQTNFTKCLEFLKKIPSTTLSQYRRGIKKTTCISNQQITKKIKTQLKKKIGACFYSKFFRYYKYYYYVLLLQ